MARVLIVAGGCRGRRLAGRLTTAGHAVRITTRGEAARSAIELAGAECWVGTPDRLATLRGALDGVTVLCWMLGAGVGSHEELRALHSERLRFFLTQAIDTTVRGVVYEGRGTSTPADVLDEGARIVREMGELHAIPVTVLAGDPVDVESWLDEAEAAIASILAPV